MVANHGGPEDFLFEGRLRLLPERNPSSRQAQLETTPELAPPAPSAQPAPVPAVFAGPSVAAPASAETAEAALAPAAAPTSAEATSATDKFPLEHQPATQPAATQLKALSKEDRRLECAALARKARSEKV